MGTSRSFGGEKKLVGKQFRDGPLGDALADVYGDIDDGFNAAEDELDELSDAVTAAIAADPTSRGSIAAASLVVKVGDFSVGDTVGIGADTYTAVAAAPVGPQFVPAGTADGSLALIAALVNNVAVGTETVLAAAFGGGSGVMALQYADAVGGTPIVGIPGAMPLAVTITGPSTAIWDTNDLSNKGTAATKNMAHGRCVMEAAAIAASDSVILGGIPWAVTDDATVLVTVLTTDGAPKVVDDVFMLDVVHSALLVIFEVGGAPLVATDVVHWTVIE